MLGTLLSRVQTWPLLVCNGLYMWPISDDMTLQDTLLHAHNYLRQMNAMIWRWSQEQCNTCKLFSVRVSYVIARVGLNFESFCSMYVCVCVWVCVGLAWLGSHTSYPQITLSCACMVRPRFSIKVKFSPTIQVKCVRYVFGGAWIQPHNLLLLLIFMWVVSLCAGDGDDEMSSFADSDDDCNSSGSKHKHLGNSLEHSDMKLAVWLRSQGGHDCRTLLISDFASEVKKWQNEHMP